MKNFYKLAQGANTNTVLHAIARQPELWNVNPLRTSYAGSAHAAADDIWVWFNEVEGRDKVAIMNDIQVVPYPAWNLIPQLRPLVFELMKLVDGVQLGRVVISRLRPGAGITPHRDEGIPATYYSRYQIALQSLPGVVFKAGDEQVSMKTGDCWWFDNTKEHSVINNSAEDRISLILDIRNG